MEDLELLSDECDNEFDNDFDRTEESVTGERSY